VRRRDRTGERAPLVGRNAAADDRGREEKVGDPLSIGRSGRPEVRTAHEISGLQGENAGGEPAVLGLRVVVEERETLSARSLHGEVAALRRIA
jgi:hypothetical protein